jgi:anti-anti-sigma factor
MTTGMTLDVEDRGGVTVVRLTGDLAGRDAGRFVKTVSGLLDRGMIHIVLDLGRVPLVTSAGLGELVRVTAQANTQGGRLMLAGVKPFVAGVLETTKLDQFFEVCPDVETAVERLKATGG